MADRRGAEEKQTLLHDHLLCHFDDLDELECKEVSIEERRLFAIKFQGKVYAYWNTCPHMGTPLNWMPDKFLNYDRDFIQCTAHGALFGITTGYCVAGPCSGDNLQKVQTARRGDAIYITAEQPLPPSLIDLRAQFLRELDDL